MKLAEVLDLFPHLILETKDPCVHQDLEILADRYQHEKSMSLEEGTLRVHSGLYRTLLKFSDDVMANGLTSDDKFTRLLAEKYIGDKQDD